GTGDDRSPPPACAEDRSRPHHPITKSAPDDPRELSIVRDKARASSFPWVSYLFLLMSIRTGPSVGTVFSSGVVSAFMYSLGKIFFLYFMARITWAREAPSVFGLLGSAPPGRSGILLMSAGSIMIFWTQTLYTPRQAPSPSLRVPSEKFPDASVTAVAS